MHISQSLNSRQQQPLTGTSQNTKIKTSAKKIATSASANPSERESKNQKMKAFLDETNS